MDMEILETSNHFMLGLFFSQIKQLNGFMTFLFIIDVKNEEAFCVDCRPTLGHNILKKHQNNEVEKSELIGSS